MAATVAKDAKNAVTQDAKSAVPESKGVQVQRKVQDVTIFREKGACLVIDVNVTPDEKGFAYLPPVRNVLDGTFRITNANGDPLVFSLETRETKKEVPFATTEEFFHANMDCLTIGPAPVKMVTPDWILAGTPGPMFRYDQVRVLPGYRMTKTETTTEKVIKVLCTTPQVLRVEYVTSALSWSPKYHVDIVGTKANVYMVAEVKNNAEALNGVDVKFATRMPKMTNGLSGMSLTEEPLAKKHCYRGRTEEQLLLLEGISPQIGNDSAAAMCAMSVVTKSGDDEDTFQLVVKDCFISNDSFCNIPLLVLKDAPVKFIYCKRDQRQTITRTCELTNTLLFTLIQSLRCTTTVDGVCIGQSDFPRISPNAKGTINLYESDEVSFKSSNELKDRIMVATVELKNNTTQPVEVDMSADIRDSMILMAVGDTVNPSVSILKMFDPYDHRRQAITRVTYKGMLPVGVTPVRLSSILPTKSAMKGGQDLTPFHDIEEPI